MSAEGVILAGGGAAILLQLAHPAVAAGVARHSDFAGAPIRRLLGTLDYVTAAVHGTDADRGLVRDRVNRAHGFVRGEGYDANDPGLQRWVAATLYVAARDVHERVFGPASPAEAESLLAAFEVLGTELRVPENSWPSSIPEFEEWWRAELDLRRVGDDARSVFEELQRPAGAPWYLRMLLPLITRVSLELLPSRLRREFAPGWSKRDRFLVELWWAVAIPLYRVLPRSIRTCLVEVQLRRLRASAESPSHRAERNS